MNPKTSLAIAGGGIVIAIVALIIGISAKNGNTSDSELSKQVAAEVSRQGKAEQGAASTAGSAQSEANTNAKSIKSTDSRLQALEAQAAKVNALEQQVTALTNQQKTNTANVQQLESQVGKLQAKVDAALSSTP